MPETNTATSILAKYADRWLRLIAVATGLLLFAVVALVNLLPTLNVEENVSLPLLLDRVTERRFESEVQLGDSTSSCLPWLGSRNDSAGTTQCVRLSDLLLAYHRAALAFASWLWVAKRHRR